MSWLLNKIDDVIDNTIQNGRPRSSSASPTKKRQRPPPPSQQHQHHRERDEWDDLIDEARRGDQKQKQSSTKGTSSQITGAAAGSPKKKSSSTSSSAPQSYPGNLKLSSSSTSPTTKNRPTPVIPGRIKAKPSTPPTTNKSKSATAATTTTTHNNTNTIRPGRLKPKPRTSPPGRIKPMQQQKKKRPDDDDDEEESGSSSSAPSHSENNNVDDEAAPIIHHDDDNNNNNNNNSDPTPGDNNNNNNNEIRIDIVSSSPLSSISSRRTPPPSSSQQVRRTPGRVIMPRRRMFDDDDEDEDSTTNNESDVDKDVLSSSKDDEDDSDINNNHLNNNNIKQEKRRSQQPRIQQRRMPAPGRLSTAAARSGRIVTTTTTRRPAGNRRIPKPKAVPTPSPSKKQQEAKQPIVKPELNNNVDTRTTQQQSITDGDYLDKGIMNEDSSAIPLSSDERQQQGDGRASKQAKPAIRVKESQTTVVQPPPAAAFDNHRDVDKHQVAEEDNRNTGADPLFVQKRRRKHATSGSPTNSSQQLQYNVPEQHYEEEMEKVVMSKESAPDDAGNQTHAALAGVEEEEQGGNAESEEEEFHDVDLDASTQAITEDEPLSFERQQSSQEKAVRSVSDDQPSSPGGQRQREERRSSSSQLFRRTSGATSIHSDGIRRHHKGSSIERIDSMQSVISLPKQVEFRSEFDVVGDLVPNWKPFHRTVWDDDGPHTTIYEEEPFDNKMNCLGVFHVRVLHVQRLPCPVGSSVQAIVSLLPWQGQVRTPPTRSFSSNTLNHGVCLLWDEDEPASRVSMLHNYSSEETPVPSIQVQLVLKTMFGMVDFTICSFTVWCQELMASPRRPRRQWFATTPNTKEADPTLEGGGVPLVEIEAVFEPAANEAEGGEAVLQEEEMSSKVVSDEEILQEMPREVSEGNNNRNTDNSGDASMIDEFSDPTSPNVPPTPIREDRPRTLTEGSVSQLSCTVNSEGGGGATKSLSIAAKPHLLRVSSHWTPAVCCVCNRSILTGPIMKRRSYHCEVCNVDCCDNCRLQVDIQLPCGSDAAERAVLQAVQNKLTMNNIMSVVAPMDEKHAAEALTAESERSQPRGSEFTTPQTYTRGSVVFDDGPLGEPRGIGRMKFEFIRAMVYNDPIPADAVALDKENLRLKRGDYYIRVSWNGDKITKRTRTMQNTGRPKFDSGIIEFIVPHYGSEFRIELVDASTNKPIGSSLVTTQTLLQHQRDANVANDGIIPTLFSVFGKPKICDRNAQHLELDLRTGMKTGYSSDFFAKVPPSTSSSDSNKARPGDIIGSIELKACMEEEVNWIYGPMPYGCPERPPHELNMALFQVHLARIFNLIQDFRDAFDWYMWVVSWKNPIVTLFSLLVFVRYCLQFNPVYFASYPVAYIIVWMSYRAFRRSRGWLKKRLLKKEVDEYRKTEKVTVTYTLHRPAGVLTVWAEKGKNLRSPELGLPANMFGRVYWDPTRYLPEQKQKSFISIDNSAGSTHEIGRTGYMYTMNPEWKTLTGSDVAKRLKHLLPNPGDNGNIFFDTTAPNEQSSAFIEFPVLQPIKMNRHDELLSLDLWKKSPAALVFEVKYQDTLSFLPGSENSLGEVVIPFSKLCDSGEVSGWFKVLDTGTTRLVALGTDDQLLGNKSKNGDKSEVVDDDPQIFIRARWIAPKAKKEGESETETEREASVVIQEEMIRSALLSKDRVKAQAGFVGTSVGAFNTVRGLSDNLLMIQNTLGYILDLLGSIRSIFNFSDPYKSAVFLWALVALWLFLYLVPTGVIVLVAGLAQYAATFVSRFGRLLRFLQKKEEAVPTPTTLQRRDSTQVEPSSPYGTWILNAIRGLPTDEDVRQTYYWECRALRAKEMQAEAESKRISRLKRLWRAQWYSSVQVLRPTSSTTKGSGVAFERLKAFAMIQGHRFLWWRTAEDFDRGESPCGRIFLSGHAGLASPSPLELRSVDDKSDYKRLTSIFGRGLQTQEKITIIAPTEEVKEQLELAVSFATSAKKD